MKLIIILSIFLTVKAGVIEDDCNGEFINGIYHDREVLITGLDRPYLLAIDRANDDLYFSYSGNPQDESFISAKLNLKTNDFKNISVDNGFAQAVDPVTHDVYIGGSDGIYKYNSKTDVAEFYAAKGKNIWTLFFKDVLYYSDFPQQILYTISDGKSVRFSDLEDTKIDSFLIDNDGEKFYTNAIGLYYQKKGTKDDVLIKRTGCMGIRGLTTDVQGNVYACQQNGIFKINKTTVSYKKVVALEDGFGVAFDNDNNVIYADSQELVRFKPNESKKCQAKNE